MFHVQVPFLKREVPAWASPLMDATVSETIAELLGQGVFSPRLIDRVWVAARCIQLNSQQIAAMPLRFLGQDPTSRDPAWTSSPDPVWFPNGIADAVFSAVRSIYGWGDAFLLVVGRYADGFPSAWTVLDPSQVNVEVEGGRKVYTIAGEPLPREDVVQISRDPGGGLRGTSALRAYASHAWSTLAAGNTQTDVLAGGSIPPIFLQPEKKITGDQARTLQTDYMAARARVGRGTPGILPPDLKVIETAIDPKDLILIESQEFDARVIATAFGVPAHLLNMAVTGGLTYNNPSMLAQQWWLFELMPMADRVASAMTAQMLPRGNAVYFEAPKEFSESLGNVTESPTAAASPSDENIRPLRPVINSTSEVRA